MISLLRIKLMMDANSVNESFATAIKILLSRQYEIPTVPIYYLAKPQPRERTWEDQRGKKTLLSLTLVSFCGGAYWA